MRRLKPMGSIVLTAAICCCGPVFAQDNQQKAAATSTIADQYPDLVELDAFGGVSLWGQVNRGLGEKLVTGGTAGGRVAYNFSRHIGLELNYNFMVNNVRLVTPIAAGLPSYNFGNQIHYWALDPVYNILPRGSRIQPYITVGVGPIDFRPTKAAKAFAQLASTEAIYNSGALRSNLQVALNYGGGVKFHISPHVGARFDVRGIFSRSPTFGLPSFNDGGIYIPGKSTINGLEATAGVVFYFGATRVATVTAIPTNPVSPLNAGEITGGSGVLCQGKPITLHATTTDPDGKKLKFAWKLNGADQGTDSPDFSFTPNNAGDFKVEVTVSDAAMMSRTVTVGPRTISVQDYTPPQIAGVTASPNTLSCAADANGIHSAALAGQVTGSACGGNLTYKWTVTEGSVTNDSSPNATFDASNLNFEGGGQGQTKTITATLTATDETGKSNSQSTTLTVNCPPQFKRLPDVVFAKNSARVNNCGKRILIDQAAQQAGSAYDILLVAHRSADEHQKVAASTRRTRAAARDLDEQRALNAAAVLMNDHGTCGTVDPAQIRIDMEGTDQSSTPDPGLCGTSNLPQAKERRGSIVTEADKERRVEVYLVPKGTQVVPPAAKNAKSAPETVVKALGCPK